VALLCEIKYETIVELFNTKASLGNSIMADGHKHLFLKEFTMIANKHAFPPSVPVRRSSTA
jgi:hypothetical protein